MSTNANDKSTAVGMISAIHPVDGFDPSALAVEYTDLNTGEVRSRLPVMAQMAWFRLVYPEGKIAVTATMVKDHYIGHAKVYHNFMDPPDCFLAEATASRQRDPDKPTVSPREWAQTAAVGIALRNAGFGLQFHTAGDAFDHVAVDETGALIEPSATDQSEATVGEPVTTEAPTVVEPSPQTETDPALEETTLEDAFAAALKLPCPIAKYPGKTLGDLLQMGEHSALVWIADKFTKDPDIAAGAKLICEKALEQSA